VRVLDASLIKTPWARRFSIGVYDSPIQVAMITVLFNTYQVVFVNNIIETPYSEEKTACGMGHYVVTFTCTVPREPSTKSGVR
jgi:hypothetical protein